MESPPDNDATTSDRSSWQALDAPATTTALDRLRIAFGRVPDAAGTAMGAFPATRLRYALFGRRVAVSVALVFLAVALAVNAAQHVTTTIGYETLESWVYGTWTGTNPETLVFVAIGALVALGAASAIANAGLVPTAILVAGPVFGAALTRYGTSYVDPQLGARVVSLPEAFAFATAVAALAALPLAIAGFVLGAGVRTVAEPVWTTLVDERSD